MRRIAFFGGSFDPVHNAHLRIAQKLPELFVLDEFNFVPAFHAPHKPDLEPLSAYHRFAMLTAATEDEPLVKVSTIELDAPEKPYTVETAEKLLNEYGGDVKIFFVIGADSWMDITAWRDWEKLLTMANFIVVERPGTEIGFSHVTPEVLERAVDLRGKRELEIIVQATEGQATEGQATEGQATEGQATEGQATEGQATEGQATEGQASEAAETANDKIYFTDAVRLDISATEIRRKITENAADWQADLPAEVAKYIDKYQIYK